MGSGHCLPHPLSQDFSNCWGLGVGWGHDPHRVTERKTAKHQVEFSRNCCGWRAWFSYVSGSYWCLIAIKLLSQSLLHPSVTTAASGLKLTKCHALSRCFPFQHLLIFFISWHTENDTACAANIQAWLLVAGGHWLGIWKSQVSPSWSVDWKIRYHATHLIHLWHATGKLCFKGIISFNKYTLVGYLYYPYL